MKLDYDKMLKEINALVQTDFCTDMEMHLIPQEKTGKPMEYTQEEAQEMAKLLSRVYSISHCTTCRACQKKYSKKQ